MEALFRIEIKKSIRLLKNYPLDFIGNTISFIVVIMGIILGVYNIGNNSNISGLVVFPLLLTLVGTPSNSLREDVELGVFDQVFNSNYTIAEVLICRSLVSYIMSLLPTSIILALVKIFLVDTNIHLTVFLLIILLVLVNGISIGMVLVGLTMMYRKIGSLLNLIYLLVLAELIIPFSHFLPIYKIIFEIVAPFGSIVSIVQATNITFENFLVATINTFIWLFIGDILYKKMYNYSRVNARLGTY